MKTSRCRPVREHKNAAPATKYSKAGKRPRRKYSGKKAQYRNTSLAPKSRNAADALGKELKSTVAVAEGAANDFNRLLTSILYNISLAKKHTKWGDAVWKKLHMVEKACLRSRAFMWRLVSLARGGETLTKKNGDIASVIRDSAEFALAGADVECELNMSGDIESVPVEEVLIYQALVNLIINAVEATPDGGVIRIRAENFIATADMGISFRYERYLRISVEDDGAGILEGDLQKIFEPFFTTKKAGRGLGLTISRSIVSRHEGHLRVESTPGVGTTVRMYLPACP